MSSDLNGQSSFETGLNKSASELLKLALEEDNDAIKAKDLCKDAESKFKKALFVDPRDNELLFNLGMTLLRHAFVSGEDKKANRIANTLDRFKESVAQQDETLKKAKSCSTKQLLVVMELKRYGSELLRLGNLAKPSKEARQLCRDAKSMFEVAFGLNPKDLDARLKFHQARYRIAEMFGNYRKMKHINWDVRELIASQAAAQVGQMGAAANLGGNLITQDSSSNPVREELLAFLWPDFKKELEQESRARHAKENIENGKGYDFSLIRAPKFILPWLLIGLMVIVSFVPGGMKPMRCLAH